MAPVSLDPDHRISLPLAEYIFRRIESLGVHSIFGVPGDYNLSLLEHLYSVPNLKWVGCCNELNSAYAADGYSRTIGNKLGVLLTTQGVGELSAINGVSGSFAEFVPILHIVGTTRLDSKRLGSHYHHIVNGLSTTDPTDHYVYEKMVSKISCKVTSLKGLESAPDAIDDLIREILKTKRPGYLYVPCDIVNSLINGSNLIDLPGSKFFEIEYPIFGTIANINSIADSILDKIYQSKNPVVLADILTDRFGLTTTLQELVDTFKMPCCNSNMGKSILNESQPWYIGDYNGDESNADVAKYVRSSDCFIHCGDYYNEINSGHFSLYKDIDLNSMIIMNSEYIKIGLKVYKGYSFQDILPSLISKINLKQQIKFFEIPKIEISIEHIKSNTPISQTVVLEKLQSFIKPNDTIVVETCSLMFGLPDLKLPKGVKLIGQHYYLSIGMALPCSFGVSVALHDLGKKESTRLVLIEGDGAAQMSVQELSNFNRPIAIKPLILLLNNNGYTVERIIKGAERDYNDIRPNWKWTNIFETFGVDSLCKKVKEIKELDDALAEFGDDTSKSRLIEIQLDKLDVPWRFHRMVGN